MNCVFLCLFHYCKYFPANILTKETCDSFSLLANVFNAMSKKIYGKNKITSSIPEIRVAIFILSQALQHQIFVLVVESNLQTFRIDSVFLKLITSDRLYFIYTPEMCKTIREKRASFPEQIYVIYANSIQGKLCSSVKLTFSSKPLSPLYLKIPVTHANGARVTVMGMGVLDPRKRKLSLQMRRSRWYRRVVPLSVLKRNRRVLN